MIRFFVSRLFGAGYFPISVQRTMAAVITSVFLHFPALLFFICNHSNNFRFLWGPPAGDFLFFEKEKIIRRDFEILSYNLIVPKKPGHVIQIFFFIASPFLPRHLIHAPRMSPYASASAVRRRSTYPASQNAAVISPYILILRFIVYHNSYT